MRWVTSFSALVMAVLFCRAYETVPPCQPVRTAAQTQIYLLTYVLGETDDHILRILDRDLLIHYTTFMVLR